jgi:putative ABC transport system permease protein
VSWFDRLRFRARAVRRAQLETEFDEELQFHLEKQTQEHIARGMAPAAARLAARREFGGAMPIKEDLREARGMHLADTFVQDVHYGARLLTRNRGFAAAAILTIALGIGATTAVFSVVYGVVLRPMPYPDAGRLVNLWSSIPEMALPRAFVSAANYRDWRAQNDVFEQLALVRHIGNFNLTGAGDPERLQGARVTASLFRVLGVAPAIGRPFRDDEEQIGREYVVILSDALWTRRFARDPGIIGQALALNGEPHEVVGIMGPEFAYPGREFELWVPLTINPRDYESRLGYNFLSVGRLRPGVTIEQAQSQMSAIAQRLERQYPANRGVGVVVVAMHQDVTGGVRTPMFVLLGAVLSLLLIGCASLANLLIARAVSRSGELVLRAALGARRGRLVRQSITELVPLFAIGGGLGLVLAYWILRVMVPWLPANMPRVEAVAINTPVLLFAVASLVFTALAVGVWPALQVGRWDVGAALRQSIRGTSASLGGGRVRDILVVVQIGVTVLLLACSALLMRSVAHLTGIDPGFRPERVATLHLAIPRAKYPRDPQVAAICRDLLDRVKQLPGVRAAGMVNRLPLAGGTQTGSVELDRSAVASNRVESADYRTVTPQYFDALGIPLIAGRVFTDADGADVPLAGIIDERIARAAWPNESPIGHRFRHAIGDDRRWITIVGVVGDIKHDGLTVDQRPQFYWNYLQRPQDRMALVVRTDGDPQAITRSVISAIREVDPEQPVYDVRPMTAVIDRSLAQQWLTTSVLLLFALVSLVLATVGVYGVVAYGVSQRAREFGVRMALGAARRDVVLMIVRRSALLIGAGLGVGVIGAIAASRTFGTLLYGVGPTDWVSYATAAAVLASTALAATLLPARRAVSIDALSVLRAD